jgi:hypothetical protein
MDNYLDAKLINLVKANTKLIQIISYETLRIHAILVKTANELYKDLFIWNRVGFFVLNSAKFEHPFFGKRPNLQYPIILRTFFGIR